MGKETQNKKTIQEINKTATAVNKALFGYTNMTSVSFQKNIICLKDGKYLKIYELKRKYATQNAIAAREELVMLLCANLERSRITTRIEKQDGKSVICQYLSVFVEAQDLATAYSQYAGIEDNILPIISRKHEIEFSDCSMNKVLEALHYNFRQEHLEAKAADILVHRGNLRNKCFVDIKRGECIDRIAYPYGDSYIVALRVIHYPERATDVLQHLLRLDGIERLFFTTEMIQYSDANWELYCHMIEQIYNKSVDVKKQKIPVEYGCSFIIQAKTLEQLESIVDDIVDYALSKNIVLASYYSQTKMVVEDVCTLGLMPNCQQLRSTNRNVAASLFI